MLAILMGLRRTVLGQNADDCEMATNVPQGHRIKDYVGITKIPRLDVFYLAFNQIINAWCF
jgi:hypothetical protein